jgi:hypothetical protein
MIFEWDGEVMVYTGEPSRAWLDDAPLFVITVTSSSKRGLLARRKDPRMVRR